MLRYGPTFFTSLARLNSSGNLDLFFNPPVAVRVIQGVVVQSDGSIVVAHTDFVRRVFSTGEIDKTFAPTPNQQNLYGVGVDWNDRIYFNDGPILRQYSGRNRV